MDFKSKIIKSIAKILHTDVVLPDEPGDQHRYAHVDSAADGALSINSEAFQGRLKEALKEASSLSRGGLQIIGLNGVREHYGAEWPKMKDTVLGITRQTIEANLDKHDVYATFYDVYFVLMFGELTIQNAQAKCALISKQISNKLFGESFRIKLIDVNIASLDENGDVHLRPVNFEDDLGETIRKKDKTYLKDVTLPGEPDENGTDGEATEEGNGGGEIDWHAIESCEQGPDADISEEDYVEMVRLSLPPREKKIYNFGKLSFSFRPMWLVENQVTSALLCIPSRVTSEGTLRVGGAALLSSPGSPVNLEYDTATVNKILSELQDLEQHGQSATLIAPVHFMTISNQKNFQPYLKAIKQIPKKYRAKILFELIAIPGGTPPGKVVEAMTALHTVVDNLLVRVRLEDRNLSRLLGPGVFAIGADVTNFNIPEKELINLIEKFSERAKALGLKTYIHGLQTRSLVSAAICSGIDFVDGEPVSGVLPSTKDTEEFNVGNLYQPVADKE